MSDAEQRAACAENASAELEALLSAAVDAVVTINEKGLVASFNPAAERMFGYDAADMIGTSITRLMSEPHRTAHQSYLDRYISTGRPRIIGVGREVEAMKKSGEIFPISLSVGEASSGASRRFVGIIRDLSKERAAEKERRSLEERLAHVGRFSLMGEMAAGIAHEINQPLSAISTYAQAAVRLMKSGSPDHDVLAEACEAIAKQAQRAGQVIENLRNFVRQHETEHVLVDINGAIKDILPFIQADARTAGIDARTVFAPRLPRVPGDAVQLQQVLLNLTRNAVDAMRGVSPKQEASIEIRTRAKDGRVEIAVTDSGPGISPRLGEAIFHPFVTSKKDGLGVGLAISKTIIEAHDGTLTFRENPRGGTVFVMSIPVHGRRGDPEGGE